MQRELTWKLHRPDRLFVGLLVYFVATILVNAALWYVSFDDWALELRRWDYGWELMLPWAAREGRWVGREISYPIGPLWQAMATLPTLGGSFTGPRTIAGLHLVFPLASLAVCAVVALSQPGHRFVRAALFAGLSIFALHDDVRTFRAVLPVAVVVAYASRTARADLSLRRSALVGGLVTLGFALSFDTGLLSTASVLFMGVYEAWLLRGGRPALKRAGTTVAMLLLGQGLLALTLALAGGSYTTFVRGSITISRAYGSTMILGPSGYDPVAALTFVGLASVLALVVAVTRVQPVAGTWLVGALPLAYRAVLRSDAEHLYAGLVPLGQVLLLVAARTAQSHRGISGSAALLTSVFALAWFGTHRDRPSAWQPTRWVALVERVVAPDAPEYRGEFAALREHIEQHRQQLSGRCIGLPASSEALHALTSIPGPTELMLGWSEPLQRQMAERVRERRCPRAVREIISFDGGSWGFSELMLAQHELYEAEGQLGPDLIPSVLRKVPVSVKESPLFADLTQPPTLSLPAVVKVPLGRPVPWEHAIRLQYTLEIGQIRFLLGGAPTLRVRFLDGNEPLSPFMSVPYAGVGRDLTSIVPIVAEVGEWRWVAARAPLQARSADHMEIAIEPRPASPDRVTFRVSGLTELAPGDEPRAVDQTCHPKRDLTLTAQSTETLFRRSTAQLSDGRVALSTNPPRDPLAEAFIPIVPCEASCLFADVSVSGPDASPIDVEAHILNAYDRPRIFEHRLAPDSLSVPLEFPLARWAGQRVLLRLGTRAVAGPSRNLAQFAAVRVGSCTSVRNLVSAAHQGQLEVTLGRAEASGHGFTLHPEPRGVMPTELLLPVEGSRKHCLALDARLTDFDQDSAGASLDIGILDGDQVVRLARLELDPNSNSSQSVRDLPLAEWQGRWVKVRLASWTRIDAPAPVMRAERVRVHACGE